MLLALNAVLPSALVLICARLAILSLSYAICNLILRQSPSSSSTRYVWPNLLLKIANCNLIFSIRSLSILNYPSEQCLSSSYFNCSNAYLALIIISRIFSSMKSIDWLCLSLQVLVTLTTFSWLSIISFSSPLDFLKLALASDSPQLSTPRSINDTRLTYFLKLFWLFTYN